MAAKDGEYLAQFYVSLDDWTDERFISKQELQALAMFNLYLVNLSEEDGWVYDGHSFKVGTPMCCLTIKATIDGIPQVVFTSGRSNTACVKAFMRKLKEGWLEWRNDRYRS